MNAAPRVSAVIPAFNAQAHLAECLASVRAQEGVPSMETIVVDDGSTDATAELARDHAGVRCIRQGNLGPAAARNAGIEVARGELIAFLDADDLWPPGKLAVQLKALEHHPQAAMVFGDCRQFDARGPRAQSEFAAGALGAAAWGRSGLVPGAYARLLQNNFITTGSVVVRRAVLAEVGAFAADLRLVEDLDLWLRIARVHQIAWCAQECLLRRRHANNLSCDAEAMGLAYLEVLRRQQPPAATGQVTHAGVDLAWLRSEGHLHLAELAWSQGRMGVAARRAWRSLAERPTPRTAWRLARSVAGQLLRQGARSEAGPK